MAVVVGLAVALVPAAALVAGAVGPGQARVPGRVQAPDPPAALARRALAPVRVAARELPPEAARRTVVAGSGRQVPAMAPDRLEAPVAEEAGTAAAW